MKYLFEELCKYCPDMSQISIGKKAIIKKFFLQNSDFCATMCQESNKCKADIAILRKEAFR